MDEYKELALESDVLGEFRDFAAEGVAMLGLKHGSSPHDAVQAVNAFIDRWQSERREKAVNDDPQDIVSTALNLGSSGATPYARSSGGSGLV